MYMLARGTETYSCIGEEQNTVPPVDVSRRHHVHTPPGRVSTPKFLETRQRPPGRSIMHVLDLQACRALPLPLPLPLIIVRHAHRSIDRRTACT
jgi:hypothetical protein